MTEVRTYKSKNKEGNEVELGFNNLTQVVLTRGDFVYREYFSKAIRAGVMTSAEANKILKDRDIWTEVQDDEVIELQLKLSKMEDSLSKLKKRDAQSITLYGDIKKQRQEIGELNSIRTSVTENTAESVAAEMRTQFFASECAVYNNTGEKVFKDLKDFLARLDESIATDSYRQALIFNYERALGITLPSDLDDTLFPEDEWAKKIDDDAEAAEKKAVTVTKKTKTRKRKTRKKITT